MRMTSQQLTAPFQQATSERSAARQQVSTCKRQLDALNQQTIDMQKSADLQRQDFERKIRNFGRSNKKLVL